MVVLGVIGYVSSVKRNIKVIKLYTVLLVVALVFLLIGSIAFIVFSLQVNGIFKEKWKQISEELIEAGKSENREEYSAQIIQNLKFAGMFGVCSFFFIIIALFAVLRMLRTQNWVKS